MNIIVGQVLWLKLPFGETDDFSKDYHPYLVISTTRFGCDVVEIGQMDSDKPWVIFKDKNVFVDSINPIETVIYKDSYLQTDRKIQIEYFDGLVQYLDTTDVMSEKKLRKTIDSYYDKRNKYGSDSFRDVFYNKEQLLKYNPYNEWLDAHSVRIEKYQKR